MTIRDTRFRFVSGNLHPDHDTIRMFRRVNEAAFAEAFLDILMMARELKLLKVGTISLDGGKIDANASRYKSVRHDRAQELRGELRRDIAQLIEAAEAADASGEASQGLPEELARRESRLARLDEACARLERQAKARAERERAEYERRLEAHESRGSKRPPPKPPGATSAPEARTNLTDPDSGLMHKSRQSEYRQAYNVQSVR